MPLDVIGTGFGRTGTDSMREALTLLGFGPCHHMVEVNANPVQKTLWRALADGAAPDWERLFQGYRSCVDWPSAFYWRTLITEYPQARVLLTWRSAESWWASMEKTILPAISTSEDRQSLGVTLIAAQVFSNRFDKDHVIRTYNANVEAVRATVPPKRLLVFEIGDGWEPLCAHLGVPVPEVPFPHANKTAEFRDRSNLDPE